MIRTDKENENYIQVPLKDLFIALNLINKEKEPELYKKVYNIFSTMNSDDYNPKGEYRLNKNSEVVAYMLDCKYIQFWDTYLNTTILGEALLRSMVEKEYELNKKIYKYYKKFVDNEIKGLSNSQLKNEIITNKEILKYIKKYDNNEQYIENMIKQQKRNKIKLEKQKKKVKTKPEEQLSVENFQQTKFKRAS